MSRMLDIDRLSITLHGISADLAEEAASGLEDAVRRRLGSLRLERMGLVPDLHVDPLDLPSGANAVVLRSLIAERLIEAFNRLPAGDDEGAV